MSDPVPIVTFVIPTFNRPYMLRRAVISALRQTIPAVKVVIRDDGGHPETPIVVKTLAKADGRISYVRNPVRLGHARNTADGVTETATEFFAILADDDVILPRMFEEALRVMREMPEVMCFYGEVVRVRDGQMLSRGTNRRYREGPYLSPGGLVDLVRNGPPNWAGAVFRRELMVRVGPPDASMSAIDYDYQVRCAALGNYFVSHTPVAIFTEHSGSLSSGGTLEDYYHLLWPSHYETMLKLRAMKVLDEDCRRQAEKVVKNQLRDQLLVLIFRAVKRGQLRLALQVLSDALLKLRGVLRGLVAMGAGLAISLPGCAKCLKRVRNKKRRVKASGEEYTEAIDYYRGISDSHGHCNSKL